MERKMDVIIKRFAKLAFTFLLVKVMFPLVATGQTLNAKRTNTPTKIKYWEYLPKSYDKGDKFPVIFFLHGKGERGDGSDSSMHKVLIHGPLKLVTSNRFGSFSSKGKDYSFIVLAPQLDVPATFWEPEYVDEFISYALEHYNIDKNRIYLTGLSMGGNGTWSYAYSSYNDPNKFAAIAPIAGWGSTQKACIVKERNIPVWGFHGKEDETVPFSRGRAMFQSLDSCESGVEKDYRFTAFDNVGHNSWSRAYDPERREDGMNLYEWFLSHRLNEDQSTALSKSLSLPDQLMAAAAGENNVSIRMITALPAALSETSGLAVDHHGGLWSHNDSGGGPYIIKFDTTGHVTGFKRVIFASNFDWEDLATDDKNNIYIGDIGNNENIRRKLFIYKISASDTSERVKAETISYYYPDQLDFPPAASEKNFDSEAMIYLKDSLYIFTKNRTDPYNGMVKVYRIPAVPGEYKAELVDSIQLDKGPMLDNWVTGADISPDGKALVLLSYRKLWLIQCFRKTKFSTGQIVKLTLDNFTQKEAVAFAGDTTLYLTDERFKKLLGGNLYTLNIKDWLSANCE